MSEVVMLSAAHIDVCVDALIDTMNVMDREAEQLVNTIDPTVLGRTLMNANIAAVRSLYDPVDVAEVRQYEQLRDQYEHRRNDAVANIWEPHRLATYRRALTSLDFYADYCPHWDGSRQHQIVGDALGEYAWRLTDSLASAGTWSWAPSDRGQVPHDFGHPERRTPWNPGLECVLVGEGEPRFFLGGEEVSARTHRVDAGGGWTWQEWCRYRDDTLARASAAARPILQAASMDPPGGAYVTGREDSGWMDPAPARHGLRVIGGEQG